MNEQQIIEAYPKIYKWLFDEYLHFNGYCWKDKNLNKIDFLHDADQREWIEDRLRELGYMLSYCYAPDKKVHGYAIINDVDNIFETTSAKSKSIALLQAVMELIEEEK